MLKLVKFHNKNKIEEYIQGGGDINIREEGLSLIHYNIKSKKIIIELVNSGFIFLEKEDYTKLNYSETESLINLISLESLKKIKINFNLISSNGQNFLFKLRDQEKIKYLISQGVDINQRDKSGDLCFRDKDNLTKELLISLGININNINNAGRTFLHYENDLKILNLLMKGNKVINQQCNTYERTCLFYASSEKMELLINNNIDINIKGKNNRIALHDVIEEKIQLLMLEKGLDISYEDRRGKNLLFMKNLSQKCIKLLINKGIDINKKDEKGLSALYYQSIDNIKILLNNGIEFDLLKMKEDNNLSITKKNLIEQFFIENILLEKNLLKENINKEKFNVEKKRL